MSSSGVVFDARGIVVDLSQAVVRAWLVNSLNALKVAPKRTKKPPGVPRSSP